MRVGTLKPNGTVQHWWKLRHLKSLVPHCCSGKAPIPEHRIDFSSDRPACKVCIIGFNREYAKALSVFVPKKKAVK